MKKTIKLEIPTSYSDISLRTYLLLQEDLKTYVDDNEAQVAFMLHHLCNIPIEDIKDIAKQSHALLEEKLMAFLENREYPIQKFITIDGVEYGFEPNLNEMSYGAYMDIVKYDTIQIDANWPKIMSILYRPITNKGIGGTYAIEKYDGKIDEEKWLNVKMDIHFGTLFFFVRLLMDCHLSILSSLKETAVGTSLHTILEKSGEAMQQSLNSRTMILGTLMK